MNLVFTGEFTYPDGMAATKRIQHFIDNLKQKINVKVFLFDQNIREQPKYIEINQKDNTPYVIIGANLKLALSLIYKIPKSLYLSCKYMAKLKVKNDVNILYVYNSLTIENIIYILFAKLIGYKIVVEYVEDFKLSAGIIRRGIYLKNKSNVLFERFLPFVVNGIVVISSYLYSKYQKYAKKIPLIHIPITAYISTQQENKLTGDSPFTVVYSGSFGSKDGLETLILAFKKFIKTFPDAQLLLTGTNKNKEMINKHLTDTRIKYAGYLPDNEFYPFLLRADVLCVTRNKMKYASAGFPFKLGEYLATGKPVITTNVGDISLYLENYKDALIVDPENTGQITDALTFLINNKEEAKNIGKRGQQKCAKFFNPSVNSEKLLEFLYQLN